MRTATGASARSRRPSSRTDADGVGGKSKKLRFISELFYCAVLWHKGALSLYPETKRNSAMTGYLITLGLAALAIWLLVDSAVEFIQDSQEDTLATEP